MDTMLVIFFGPLMAGGIIDAWRFFKTVAVSIPVIVIILCRYWQETALFSNLDMHSISHLIKKAA